MLLPRWRDTAFICLYAAALLLSPALIPNPVQQHAAAGNPSTEQTQCYMGDKANIVIRFSDPVYDAALTSFAVKEVILEHSDVACVGQSFTLTVLGNDGVSVSSVVGAFTEDITVVMLPVAIPVTLVSGVSLVSF